MSRPILKTFNDAGCLSHVVADGETRAALLVDPKAGRRSLYEKALKDFDLKLAAVLDTHTHADHLSDSAAWLDLGLPLYMGARTGCRRRHVKLKQDGVVEVGRLAFTALDVPGHTPDSIALFGHGIVLTGDTLLVGGLARADFRGSDPAQLFESVQSRLMRLPDETVVLPGHGYQDLLFSTIGHERARNPALRHASGAAYAKALDVVEGRGNTPDVDATLATNLEEHPKIPAGPRAVAACCSMGSATIGSIQAREQTCEELAPRVQELVARHAWIDVRDPWEWKAGHIPGVPNFPLSELGFHLDELMKLQPQVLSCRSGARSLTAARTLAYLGVLNDPISMAGGFGRWEELRLPVEK
jgi:glyoxylase-like metal-dependent hydrolase (beta-lactamase superfamily II)/rhodanese-related sulfurtransferase